MVEDHACFRAVLSGIGRCDSQMSVAYRLLQDRSFQCHAGGSQMTPEQNHATRKCSGGFRESSSKCRDCDSRNRKRAACGGSMRPRATRCLAPWSTRSFCSEPATARSCVSSTRRPSKPQSGHATWREPLEVTTFPHLRNPARRLDASLSFEPSASRPNHLPISPGGRPSGRRPRPTLRTQRQTQNSLNPQSCSRSRVPRFLR